jgi:uncharacterized membrane protein SpoIIM required for sporulation
MNLDRFLADRARFWGELEELVTSARRRPERLGPDRVMRLGSLYRSAAADLALARRRFPDDPVVRGLEDLVGRARHLVYDAPPRRRSLARFWARDYWRRVAERPLPLAVAAALLMAPAALAGSWALDDPGAAGGLVPEEFRSVTEPTPADEDPRLSGEEQALFASSIFTNNIRVTFLAFAGGIAAGLVTAAVVIYNGVLLGAVAGLAVGAGNGERFFRLVTAHGVLELSCIVVTAAAGLRMGWALVDPGPGTRLDALVSEARRAVEIVLGTAPWLVLAGVVEAFVTPAGLGWRPVVTVGAALGALYWALVWWRGRA